MITQKTIDVYTFDSLPESAKETVRHYYYEQPYHWQGEANDTLQEFLSLFPRHYVVNYSIGTYSYDSKIVVSGDESEISGIRLWKWIYNYLSNATDMYGHKILAHYEHCTLTGYYLDHDILEPLADFYLDPRSRSDWRTVTLQDILSDCLSAYCKTVQTDMEYQTTDEYIIEDCEANEILFDEHGRII